MHSLEGFPACYRHLCSLTCWGNMVAKASLANSAGLLGKPLHAKACLASLALPGFAWLAWHCMAKACQAWHGFAWRWCWV